MVLSKSALFIIVKRRKQPKCPLMDEWINKMRDTHTVEYYSAFKRKAILSHATMWMNHEDTVLSKSSSHKRQILYAWFQLHELARAVKFIETESRMVAIWGWGGGKDEGSLFNGFPFCKMEKFWSPVLQTFPWVCLTPQKCTLQNSYDGKLYTTGFSTTT